ncbi:MAG: competence protein CoiA family protein [Prevotella sp.]|jgi:hypothetical protein
MKSLKPYLTYALNKKGELVHIDSVPNGNECGCICPHCKKPLCAKNGGDGKRRVHHFAHQSGSECALGYETMLHLLAKERIQKAFLESNSFAIDFEYKSYCIKEHQCNYIRYGRCYDGTRKHFNLKQFYDRCEQEIPYDNINRRSDLKISSSAHPDREPIYIEFCVTHASDAEKLHSGKKIIECIIEDENDINNIIEKGFIEDSLENKDYDFPDVKSKIQFYGFINTDESNQLINREIIVSRYMLFPSGKMISLRNVCNCKKKFKKSRLNTLFEAVFYTSDSFSISDYAKYLGWEKYHISNCLLCKNYVNSYSGMGKICRLYKLLQIPKYEDFDTARAKLCQYFIFNKEERDEQFAKGCNIPFEEI